MIQSGNWRVARDTVWELEGHVIQSGNCEGKRLMLHNGVHMDHPTAAHMDYIIMEWRPVVVKTCETFFFL